MIYVYRLYIGPCGVSEWRKKLAELLDLPLDRIITGTEHVYVPLPCEDDTAAVCYLRDKAREKGVPCPFYHRDVYRLRAASKRLQLGGKNNRRRVRHVHLYFEVNGKNVAQSTIIGRVYPSADGHWGAEDRDGQSHGENYLTDWAAASQLKLGLGL